jgi:hypothetical protein
MTESEIPMIDMGEISPKDIGVAERLVAGIREYCDAKEAYERLAPERREAGLAELERAKVKALALLRAEFPREWN